MMSLAEASACYAPLSPGDQLVRQPGYVVFICDPGRADGIAVQRLRLEAEEVERAVREIRATVREHGGVGANWEISTEATPSDLIDRLARLGLRPAQVPLAVVMGIDSPPKRSPSGIVVQRVTTPDDFKTHVTVGHTAFDKLDRLPRAIADIDDHGAADLAQDTFVRYTAFVDGEPVGIATATFTSGGVMLHSGCTLAAHRRRGVYAALVLHRWGEAVLRGTPRLITRAGPMSRPVLLGLGFAELGQIHFLEDVL